MKTLNLTHQPPDLSEIADTERLGLPSASSAARLAHCPGSWRMERNQPQIGKYSALADAGTRIHNWLSGNTGETLSEDEMRIAQSCKRGFEKLKIEWIATLPDPPFDVEDLPEVRRFLHAGLRPALSGKWDVLSVAADGRHLLLVDYKTGWQDLPPVRHNLQLRDYALLAWAAYPQAESVAVAIVRPGDEDNERAWFHAYTVADLEAAWFALEQRLSAVFSPAPALVAGDHCQFCKAQFTCPARVAALHTLRADSVGVMTWEDLTASERVELLRLWKLVKKFGESVEDKIREDLELGVPLPGVTIGKGRAMTEIADAQAAYARAIAAGMTHDQFMGMIKVSFAKLRDGIAKIAGWKGKEAGAKAAALFDGLITETTSKGGLEVA